MSQKSDDFDFDLSNLDDLGLDDLNDITDIDFSMDLEKVIHFLPSLSDSRDRTCRVSCT